MWQINILYWGLTIYWERPRQGNCDPLERIHLFLYTLLLGKNEELDLQWMSLKIITGSEIGQDQIGLLFSSFTMGVKIFTVLPWSFFQPRPFCTKYIHIHVVPFRHIPVQVPDFYYTLTLLKVTDNIPHYRRIGIFNFTQKKLQQYHKGLAITKIFCHIISVYYVSCLNVFTFTCWLLRQTTQTFQMLH